MRHVDSQFDEVGEIWVIWACVADLSREGFSSNSTWDTGLTHTCKELKSVNLHNQDKSTLV